VSIKVITRAGNVRCLSLLLFFAFLVGCSASTPSFDANDADTVTLQGQLLDAATSEPIVGAKIEIGSRSAITDENGYYEIRNFPSNAVGDVARDYRATITLTKVSAPVSMAGTTVSSRYPDRKFAAPETLGAADANTIHNFRIGKLSTSILGVIQDESGLPVGGAIIELIENVTEKVVRNTTSDLESGEYTFANIEAGIDYKLVGRSSDGMLQGEVTTGKLADNQTLLLPLGGTNTLVLKSSDTFSPRIIAVTPENNSDISPGAIDVVLAFNEPIYLDGYSIPNPLAAISNIYHDIDVSYGGHKAAGNLAHSLSWNETFDMLTIQIPNTGVSSIYTVDLSLLSPKTVGETTTLGKLKDLAGNGLSNSPVLTAGNLLTFTTNGGVLANAPVLISTNASALDSSTTSVILDWLPVSGATNGYNVYRSTRNDLDTSIVEPFIFLAGPIPESLFADTFDGSGFNLLLTQEFAQHYVYRVTSINSDLIESDPSNEVVIRDVISPSVVGTAGECVPPGGDKLSVTIPISTTENGQVQVNFSEPLDVISAETISNYTSTNVVAAKLTTPTTVVLDFSVPINCVNTETVVVGNGISDVAGNFISGNLEQRTISYIP